MDWMDSVHDIEKHPPPGNSVVNDAPKVATEHGITGLYAGGMIFWLEMAVNAGFPAKCVDHWRSVWAIDLASH